LALEPIWVAHGWFKAFSLYFYMGRIAKNIHVLGHLMTKTEENHWELREFSKNDKKPEFSERNDVLSMKSFLIRYGTKIKNCSGFMRVHRILKVWSLLTTKIIISPK
jgi:hypothetical protein